MANKKNKPVNNPEPAEEVVMDDPNMVTAEEAQAVEAPVEEVLEQAIEKIVEEAPEVPKKATKSSSSFSDDLKGTLEKHPHINNVWVNDKGEWYYSKKAGFTSYSREEILNG